MRKGNECENDRCFQQRTELSPPYLQSPALFARNASSSLHVHESEALIFTCWRRNKGHSHAGPELLNFIDMLLIQTYVNICIFCIHYFSTTGVARCRKPACPPRGGTTIVRQHPSAISICAYLLCCGHPLHSSAALSTKSSVICSLVSIRLFTLCKHLVQHQTPPTSSQAHDALTQYRAGKNTNQKNNQN